MGDLMHFSIAHVLATASLFALSVGVASFFAALYIGERGRRKDIAWLVGREVGAEPEPATVRYTPDAETKAAELMSSEQKEALINDIIADSGASFNDAKAEAERMLAELHGMGVY